MGALLERRPDGTSMGPSLFSDGDGFQRGAVERPADHTSMGPSLFSDGDPLDEPRHIRA